MAPPVDHRSRSPLRERERAISPQRGNEFDYGQDAEKHVRHIARTQQLKTIAGEEGVRRTWPWVLQSLVHRRSSRGLGCPADILDTVVYSIDGAPEALFYTSEGTVMSRVIADDEGCISMAKAIAQLQPPQKYAAALAAASETRGAVAFTSSGEVVTIKTADVEKIRKGQGTAPTATETLVRLVPTLSPCAEPLLGIQHTFTLEPSTAKPVHRSYRLAVLKGVSERIPCKSSTLNQKLERCCKQIVVWIAAYGGARVLRLVLEFVEDALGDLWLVRSSECSTTKTVRPYSRQRRSPYPSQSKNARIQISQGIADELYTLRYGHGIGESSPTPAAGLRVKVASPPGQAPREPRFGGRRPYTAMSPTEAVGSQATVDAEEWGLEESELPNKSPDASRPQTTALETKNAGKVAKRFDRRDNINEGCRDGGGIERVAFRGFADSGERDPREVGRTAAAGRALGSSQLGRMCYGDFCDTDLLDKVYTHAAVNRLQAFMVYCTPRT